MNMLRKTLTCWLLLGVAGFTLPSFTHAQQMPGTILVIAVTPTFNVGALLLAQEKGIFKKHGLDATIHIVKDPAAILKGVTSMQYDIGYANVISNLQAIDRKQPIVLVHPAYEYPEEASEDPHQFYVAPNSKIRQLSDLATAKIGVPYLHNIAEWSIRKILDNQGISDHRKIRWRQVSIENAYNFVLNGTVDGVWLKQPEGNMAKAAGLIPAFSVSTNALPGATGGYYYTSKKFSIKYWDLLSKFQIAMTEANFYASQYPSHNREAIAKYLHIDPSLVDAANLNNHSNDIGLPHLKTIITDALRYRLIRRAPNTDLVFWKK